MNPRELFRVLRGVCGFLLVLLPLGCSQGGSSVQASGEATHIAAAAHAVQEYMKENKGQIPKSTDEIKAWAAKNSIADDALVSTRDHQPYLVFEVTLGGMGKQLILTEKEGVKGKKFLFSSMNPNRIGAESTEEEVQNMLKGVAPERKPKSSSGPPN